jgi:catechol 2,3-dioxygenase-like lactoylglutathione lyase family enzyme
MPEMVMKVYTISAITLNTENMKRSCNFYSHIPGFKIVYGGSATDSFTTYKIGSRDSKNNPRTYLNLELSSLINTDCNGNNERKHLGRIIFHTEDVDKLYFYLKNNQDISNSILFGNEPKDAPWGERYFHITEPDGYQITFAMPLRKHA